MYFPVHLHFFVELLVNKPLLNEVSNETNKDVRMYTWRIYSGRCNHIAAHGWTEYALEML